MSKVNKLSEVLPPELQEAVSRPLDDYMDVDLVIHATREVQGNNGVYMRFVVSLPGETEQFYLATGGSQPVEILRYLKEKRLFPVAGRFVKKGRAILLMSAEDTPDPEA